MNIIKAVFAGFALMLASAAWAGSIDINTADAKTLEGLNGIGPVKAKAIIEYRTKNGPFKSIDALEAVPGVGAETIAKNRDQLSVGGKAASPKKDP